MTGALRSATVEIPPTLNGPAGSANGGVAAGALAALVGGPVEVRLHRPPPLGRRMEVIEDGDAVVAVLDGDPVLTARAGSVELDVPVVGLPLARSVTGPPPTHAAPTCVVCGPDAETPLGVFPGPLPDSPVFAAAWRAPAWADDGEGLVRPELLWGVLDCPGGFALTDPRRSDGDVFPALAGMTATLLAPVRVGEPVVVLGWPLAREGRKLHAATAILGERGDVRAMARQICIGVPLEWAGASG